MEVSPLESGTPKQTKPLIGERYSSSSTSTVISINGRYGSTHYLR